MYITLQMVQALIPADILMQALSDGDGTQIDDAIWQQIAAIAAAAVDGPLSQRYAVPIGAPVPAVVSDCALVFTCEAIFQRRGVAPEANPFSARARECRTRLSLIGSGRDPLTAGSIKSAPSGSLVTEPSRLGDQLLA